MMLLLAARHPLVCLGCCSGKSLLTLGGTEQWCLDCEVEVLSHTAGSGGHGREIVTGPR